MASSVVYLVAPEESAWDGCKTVLRDWGKGPRRTLIESGGLDHAHDEIRHLRPAICVVLEATPAERAISLLSELRVAQPGVAVTVVLDTADRNTLDTFAALGVVGCLLREDVTHSLLSRCFPSSGDRNGVVTSRMLLTANGGAPRKRPDAAVEARPALSGRELEVLRLISAGVPVKQIQKRLSIGRTTVQDYLRRLRDKLGADSVAQLTALAEHHGYLQPPVPPR